MRGGSSSNMTSMMMMMMMCFCMASCAMTMMGMGPLGGLFSGLFSAAEGAGDLIGGAGKGVGKAASGLGSVLSGDAFKGPSLKKVASFGDIVTKMCNQCKSQNWQGKFEGKSDCSKLREGCVENGF